MENDINEENSFDHIEVVVDCSEQCRVLVELVNYRRHIASTGQPKRVNRRQWRRLAIVSVDCRCQQPDSKIFV